MASPPSNLKPSKNMPPVNCMRHTPHKYHSKEGVLWRLGLVSISGSGIGEMWRDSSEGSLLHKFGGLLRSGALDKGDGAVKDIERSYRSEDRCSTRRVIKSKCTTEEIEPGKFVKKCEKTEQLLRDCVGRPTELVESKNEYTEEDVSRDAVSFSSPLDERHRLAELEPYIPPVLRSNIDQFERGVFGGLESFIHAAEQMANDFFHNFGFPEHRESSFGRFKDGNLERGVNDFQYEQKHNGNKPHKIEEADYADYAKDFKEI